MNIMIELSIRAKTRPLKEFEFAQIMESLVKEFRKEPGCLACHFKREKNSEFLMTSEWETMEELEGHFQSQLFSVLLGAFDTLCKTPEVKITDGKMTFGVEAMMAARGE
jgi:quinol monooxygenase YgiN